VAAAELVASASRYALHGMGFVLTDLGDEDKIVFVNFWNWRPTVELIRSFEIIPEQRLVDLGEQCMGAEVTKAEAREIGRRINAEVLPKLAVDERVLWDLSTTREPDDGTFHKGADQYRNYGATRDWLEKFAAFCLSCDGFEVM